MEEVSLDLDNFAEDGSGAENYFLTKDGALQLAIPGTTTAFRSTLNSNVYTIGWLLKQIADSNFKITTDSTGVATVEVVTDSAIMEAVTSSVTKNMTGESTEGDTPEETKKVADEIIADEIEAGNNVNENDMIYIKTGEINEA